MKLPILEIRHVGIDTHWREWRWDLSIQNWSSERAIRHLDALLHGETVRVLTRGGHVQEARMK